MVRKFKIIIIKNKHKKRILQKKIMEEFSLLIKNQFSFKLDQIKQQGPATFFLVYLKFFLILSNLILYKSYLMLFILIDLALFKGININSVLNTVNYYSFLTNNEILTDIIEDFSVNDVSSPTKPETGIMVTSSSNDNPFSFQTSLGYSLTSIGLCAVTSLVLNVLGLPTLITAAPVVLSKIGVGTKTAIVISTAAVGTAGAISGSVGGTQAAAKTGTFIAALPLIIGKIFGNSDSPGPDDKSSNFGLESENVREICEDVAASFFSPIINWDLAKSAIKFLAFIGGSLHNENKTNSSLNPDAIDNYVESVAKAPVARELDPDKLNRYRPTRWWNDENPLSSPAPANNSEFSDDFKTLKDVLDFIGTFQ